MEKSKREKDFLYKWACGNYDKYREKGGLEGDSRDFQDSFFINRRQVDYLKEYCPNDLEDFHHLLHEEWGEDDIMSKVLITVEVAIMKNKPSSGEGNLRQESSELPGYIYNF
ncbi:hypothetical protein [Butyrivibrio hungatei]|uniref:Uncharacterized protein n=1 Tax=Butyrivibrio hungatei TaxID=185008 RepID=A0A1D9P3W2_9FIRM|nr:hypothetical protein [Butyrivibrio hungatei]AOZ97317.1 hypothetical protein bhn_I2284 [Butyrivibrio hungatei]